MTTLRYYITGHGLGHASRSCQVIHALKQRHPEIQVEVVSSAHPWFLARYLPPEVAVRSLALDIGVLQRDSLQMHEEETLRACRQWEPELALRVADEAASLRRSNVALVVADVPGAACRAAEQAGVPAVIVANFSWDWVYDHFNQKWGGYDDVVANQKADIERAQLWLKLPFGPPETRPFPVETMPMIARHAVQDRVEVCRQLAIDPAQRLALLCFGGFGLDQMDLAALADLQGWLILGEVPGPPGLSTYRQITDNDPPFPDLVGAVDVMISKPGYGIVSEAIVNDTAVLYTPRGDFPEQPILENALQKYTRSYPISNQSLRSGNWEEGLHALMQQAEPAQTLPGDGATVVAQRLLLAMQELRS